MEKTLVVATKNPGKLKEYAELLTQYPIRLTSLASYPDIKVVEDGSTFEENAIKKAKTVALATNSYSLADDSGLEVLSLGGRPGIHTARYAGQGATDEDNMQKLLRDMEDISWEDRQAQFVCSLALSSPKGQVSIVKGYLKGRITFEPIGHQGFGYDPVFYLDKEGVTLAQLGQAEKNKLSHRFRAFEKMKVYLPDMLRCCIDESRNN